MIKVVVSKHNGAYRSLHAYGHAGYAEYGKDIVCSAVSILIVNTANGLESFTNDLILSEIHEDGTTEILLKEEISSGGTLLMDTLMLGLNDIKEQYGNNFLRIEYKEV